MRTLLTLLAGLALGCSTHVGIATTHREDVSAQSRVLAIAARNLDDTTRGRASADTAQIVAKFHNESEEFARAAGRWVSDENVDTRYERLIDTWVKVRQIAPALRADSVLNDSFRRVEYEWEKLARVTGYAGKKYEEKAEQGTR